MQIGTEAALSLSGGEKLSPTIGIELLIDIQTIFESRETDRISTADLIATLCLDDEKPWAGFNKGQPIKPRQLARLLKAYDIGSKSVRIGVETPKGFELAQFADAFSRYCSPPPENIRHTPQTTPDKDYSVADDVFYTDRKKKQTTGKPSPNMDCGGVADKTPPIEGQGFYVGAKQSLREVRI